MLAALMLAGHVLVYVFLLLGAVCSAETPRVALMFASRGPMPLEDVWKQFLGSVQGLRPPPLSQEQWNEVMQEHKVREVERRIRRVGQFTPNSIVSNKTCVVNSDIMVRASFPALSLVHISSSRSNGAPLLQSANHKHQVARIMLIKCLS